jgi:hypothetical protein
MKVQVYLDDGRVFEYEVPTEEKAREHSFAIVTTGYRHVAGSDADATLEHYPPHRINKVKVSGGVSTLYKDVVRGT